ncbi:hypothetical protein NMY22_g11478 [Coprinellus aureogranulatus]|nr:hypothetical protein NMY22_g11478 [Coprinellus aureogranulatus]
MPMMNDLIGFGWHFGFAPYGEEWKERRKLFVQAFGPNNAEKYQPSLVKATRTFLLHVLDDPRNFREHSRLLAGSFILDLTYGLEIASKDDVYITQAEKGMSAMAAAGTASTYIVDFIPRLKALPEWFPGAIFKRHAAKWRPDVLAMAREPLKHVEETLKAGNARPSVAAELLQELDEDDEMYQEKRKVIHDTLASVYAAGSDTTVSSIATFFLAMAQNPNIQRKAQSHINEIIASRDRLPDFSDHPDLPYIEALVREVLRWRPVTPIGVPHAVTQDDVYVDGTSGKTYHIPGGATVLPNCYAIAHDPSLYGPNTHIFDPSRFMNKEQTKIREDAPMGYETFGYGRRICPGLHIAVESIWLVVASVLAVFDIGLKEGSEGEKEKGGSEFGKYTSGMLIHPLPFEVKIVPRSKAAEALSPTFLCTTRTLYKPSSPVHNNKYTIHEPEAWHGVSAIIDHCEYLLTAASEFALSARELTCQARSSWKAQLECIPGLGPNYRHTKHHSLGSIPSVTIPNNAAFAALAMASAVAVLTYRTFLSKSKRRPPLPPGPPGLPIVGNAFDVPAEEFWWKYKEWSDQYGSDVIYLKILGTDIIVLNSLAACRELLDKRSAIYSSRPNMPMMNDLIGFDWNFAFQPYGEGWRERRKLFIRAVGPSNAKKYRPALAKATTKFLLDILDDPHNFRQHSRLLAGSFILDISYGLEVTSKDDVYITQAEKGMLAMAAAGSGSSYIVDFIPSLKFLPSWFPGAAFKRHAAAWRPDVLAIASRAF